MRIKEIFNNVKMVVTFNTLCQRQACFNFKFCQQKYCGFHLLRPLLTDQDDIVPCCSYHKCRRCKKFIIRQPCERCRCQYPECQDYINPQARVQQNNISVYFGKADYCEMHLCQHRDLAGIRCSHQIVRESAHYCKEHLCQFRYCVNKTSYGLVFCADHLTLLTKIKNE